MSCYSLLITIVSYKLITNLKVEATLASGFGAVLVAEEPSQVTNIKNTMPLCAPTNPNSLHFSRLSHGFL